MIWVIILKMFSNFTIISLAQKAKEKGKFELDWNSCTSKFTSIWISSKSMQCEFVSIMNFFHGLFFVLQWTEMCFYFILFFCSVLFGIQTLRAKCFDKCITKPGSSLSGSESSCISRCMDRYVEATGIISRALFSGPPQWKFLFSFLKKQCQILIENPLFQIVIPN